MDNNSPEIKHTVETTSSPDLATVINRTPQVQVYKEVLDKGGFSPSGDSNIPMRADSGIVKTAVETIMLPWFDQFKSRNADKGISLPDSLDGEKESKVALQESISLLANSGLVSIEVIRAGALYAGVGNIHYDRNMVNHHFYPTDKYYAHLKEKSTYIQHGQPFPVFQNQRNKHFTLDVGGEGIEIRANDLYSVAKKIGIPLTSEQAIKLAFIKGVAHEYGHAVLRGAQHLGIPVLERARNRGFMRGREVIGDESRLHDEHMAEGLSVAIVEEYLRNKLDFTEEQVKKLLEADYQDAYNRGEAAYAFFDYAAQKGLTPKEIQSLSSAFMYTARENFPDVPLWRLDDIVYYLTQPYTKEQIQEMLK